MARCPPTWEFAVARQTDGLFLGSQPNLRLRGVT